MNGGSDGIDFSGCQNWEGKSELLVEVFSILAIATVLTILKPALVIASPIMVAGKGLRINPRTLHRLFDAVMVCAILITDGTAL